MRLISIKIAAVFLWIGLMSGLNTSASPCNFKSVLTDLTTKTRKKIARWQLPESYQNLNQAAYSESFSRYRAFIKESSQIRFPDQIEDQFALINALNAEKKTGVGIDLKRLSDPESALVVKESFRSVPTTRANQNRVQKLWKKYLAQKKPTSRDLEILYSNLYALEYGSAISWKDFYRVWSAPRYQSIAARLYEERLAVEGLKKVVYFDEIAKTPLWKKVVKAPFEVMAGFPNIRFSSEALREIALGGEKTAHRYLHTRFKLNVSYQRVRPLVITAIGYTLYWLTPESDEDQLERKKAEAQADAVADGFNQGVRSHDKEVEFDKSELEILVEDQIEAEEARLRRKLTPEEKAEIQKSFGL